MVSSQVIGQSIVRVEGEEKVTGKAVYTSDVHLPGTLWAKVLRSPYPHARVLHIDTSKAEKLPGVHAVLTGADVAGIRYGRGLRDVPVLAQDRVRFVGERVAAVAADDREIAQQAVELIEVEYEELPALFDPLEAMRPDAPILHPDVNSYERLPKQLEKVSNVFAREIVVRGNLEEGFAQSDLVVENTFTVQRNHQAYLEPHSCLVWIDEQERVQVWAPCKAPHILRDTLASALGLPEEQICVNPVLIGGDFGGKGAAMDEPIAYFLARRTGRPVKMVMTYVEELTAAAPRHAGVIRLKTGVMRDGTLVAQQMEAIFDAGGYGGVGAMISMASAGHGGVYYRIPHARIETLRVYTNNIPGGVARAPGEPQGFFAAESQMDCVAHALNMDPFEFRMKNLIHDGEEMVTGMRYEGITVKETLQAAVERANYSAPKGANVGRGVAVGYRSPGGGGSSASVVLNLDGSVVVNTSLFDQGSGTYTLLRQVVAQEFALPPERVQINVLNTDAPLDGTGVGGSRATRVYTETAFRAATGAKEQLLRLTAEMLEWPEDEIGLEGDEVLRRDTNRRYPWAELLNQLGRPIFCQVISQDAEPAPLTAFAAQVAEVSVDPETGQVKLLSFTTAHDVGTIVNPMGHQGQIDGGVVQGIGYGLMEEVLLEEGHVGTAHFGEYKIPTCQDIPELRTVLVQAASGAGPYSVKGIGENPIVPTAAAIANAVEDAVGVRIRDLPITAEKVYSALREKEAQNRKSPAASSSKR